jgi:hypothetical protein
MIIVKALTETVKFVYARPRKYLSNFTTAGVATDKISTHPEMDKAVIFAREEQGLRM